MSKVITTEQAPLPVGPYSQAILKNGFLFISGQIPVNPQTNTVVESSLEDQVDQVMQNLKAILTSAGMSFSEVVKTTIFIRDMDKFKAINEVYRSFLTEPYPARETVEVSRLPLDVQLDISMIAAL